MVETHVFFSWCLIMIIIVLYPNIVSFCIMTCGFNFFFVNFMLIIVSGNRNTGNKKKIICNLKHYKKRQTLFLELLLQVLEFSASPPHFFYASDCMYIKIRFFSSFLFSRSRCVCTSSVYLYIVLFVFQYLNMWIVNKLTKVLHLKPFPCLSYLFILPHVFFSQFYTSVSFIVVTESNSFRPNT